jgi:DNA-binding response OmpR family regulator
MDAKADRILVVDRDAFARRGLEDFLKFAGFSVDVAAGEPEAIAAVRAARPDLVLVDIGRDGTGGLRLVRDLREGWPRLPVMAMTVQGSLDSCMDAVRAGVCDYLLKPVEHQELVHRIRRILRDHRTRARAEQAERFADKSASLQTLAGGIAHDLNNQLTVILGSVQEMEDFVRTEEDRQECLHTIRRGSTVIAGLAEKLLSYSGGGLFEVEAHDLQEYLPGQIQEMGWRLLSAMGNTTSIQIKVGQTPLPVVVDQLKLGRVMEGILCNALESIPDGKGEVLVEIDAATVNKAARVGRLEIPGLPAGRYARIRISDTGIGMGADSLHRVFEPFFSTKSTGRGLGLAGAQGVIRAHGGMMTVASELGSGTVMTCYLPLHDLGLPIPLPSIAPSPAAARVGGGATCSGRVLIIDDEDDVRHMAARILSRSGLKVTECDGGLRGVELYRSMHDKLDVVVLDLSMPDLDGVDVLGRLRRINPAVKVVLVSGYHVREVTSRFTDHRPNAFVQKPFDVGQLLHAVVGLIDEQADAHPGDSKPDAATPG